MCRGPAAKTFDVEHAVAMNGLAKQLGRDLPFPWVEEGLDRAAGLPREEFGFASRIEQPTGDCEAALEAICRDEDAMADLPTRDATADALDPPLESSAASACLHPPFRI